MKNDPFIIASFLNAMEREQWMADGTRPLVTVSRQFGAEGEAIASRTAEILTAQSRDRHPWIVVDKDIAERVITDHHLPGRIKRFFTDEQTLSIEEHLEGLLGISVPGATMMQKMGETIVRLARIGHVVFVGRAAHIITAKFPRAVHVRVVGSPERRAERIALLQKITMDEAMAEVRKVDHQRRDFLATFFHAEVNEPTRYDMIFNTDRVSVEESAQLIAHLVSSPNFREVQAERLRELRHQVLG